MADPRAATGLVVGKFMPLHRGHVALLQFAQAQVEHLYIVVDHLPDARMDGDMRCHWIRQTMPRATVLHLPHPNPQDPSEHADFWTIWRDSLLALLPRPPALVIASETYGAPLADILGARFVPYDIARTELPIRATEIRGNLFERWAELAEHARPDHLMRVCLFGAESTGKTTLAQQLAAHFHTAYVPEYARAWIKTHGDPTAAEMLPIAHGQLALEAEHATRANRILFCDTDPLMTALWHRWLFKTPSPELEALAAQTHYDLYLLTDTDLPWVADAVRYFPDDRARFTQECIAALDAWGRPYRIISGSGPDRLAQAVAAISQAAPAIFAKKWG